MGVLYMSSLSNWVTFLVRIITCGKAVNRANSYTIIINLLLTFRGSARKAVCRAWSDGMPRQVEARQRREKKRNGTGTISKLQAIVFPISSR